MSNDNQAAIETDGDRAITITREFDAPVEKVFRAMHEPELVAQWIGPDGLENVEVTQDNQHGGTWKFVQRDADGNEYAFRGVMHGDPTPELSQRTFEWLGLPGHACFESMRMEDLGDGRTGIKQVSVFTTPEDRDGMFASGMAEGVNGGFAKMDRLLETL